MARFHIIKSAAPVLLPPTHKFEFRVFGADKTLLLTGECDDEPGLPGAIDLLMPFEHLEPYLVFREKTPGDTIKWVLMN
jgi:hypothetical protein